MTGSEASEGWGLAAATADVRRSIAELGAAIDGLRGEADSLRARADARAAVAVLERQAETEDEVDPVAALAGRHAADVPEEFDPTPYDPADDGDAEHAVASLREGAAAALAAISGHESGPAPADPAFQDLAAAPAFDGGAEGGGHLPAIDAGELAPNLTSGRDDTTLAPEAIDDDGHVADIIEFTPRHAPDENESDAPAFGALVPDFDQSTPPPPVLPDGDEVENAGASTGEVRPVEPLPADVEQAFGGGADGGAGDGDAPAPENARPRSDGLDAIAFSESTDVPADWDDAADEDAFDKFFSSDVEPEPAQRWLLNE